MLHRSHAVYRIVHTADGALWFCRLTKRERWAIQLVSGKSFGGSHTGDDVAHLLDPGRKPLATLLKLHLREFDLRQWLFACQAEMLFERGRALQVGAPRPNLSVPLSPSHSLSQLSSELPRPHSLTPSLC